MAKNCWLLSHFEVVIPMNTDNSRPTPNEQTITSILFAMTEEEVLSVTRMTTGEQHFVYAIRTPETEYVLRLTDISKKHKFHSAVAWQKRLLPLGIPLAKFIKSDLDCQYSPYPALLMMRLPGDDLVNIYSELTDANKKSLANEMVNIQALCRKLPEGSGYGILDSYNDSRIEKTWYQFLSKKLELYQQQITKTGIFNPQLAFDVLKIANDMEENFRMIRPLPFLWDASERNVLVHEGKIAGIVDVDEVCFGDPLLVIALTSTCLELEGLDTVYTDYWIEALHLDNPAQARLDFYRLFYALGFMHKHSMQTANGKKVVFDIEKLLSIFNCSLERLRNRDR
jgi:hypothetical protein